MLRPLLTALSCLLSVVALAQDTLTFGGIDLPGAEVRATYRRVSPLAQAFTIEEVRRLPATFFDPARLIALLPGTVQTNDQANHLSVRGNTPNANLWRLNGLAVVNPNHTSNAGTFYDTPTLTGGGTNALSAQVLDNSAFLAAGLPARYGNVTGGTFDLRLRPGNHDRRQHQVQAGFIGFDAATEGPTANPDISYLVNARYSFTGLLANLGVGFGGEAIGFYDLNAHLHWETDRGEVSLFTVLGRSTNDYTPDPEDEITEQKQLFNIDFQNDLVIGGASFRQEIRPGTLTGGLAYSEFETERFQTFVDETGEESTASLFHSRLSTYADLERIVSQRVTLNVGAEFLRDGAEHTAFYLDRPGTAMYSNLVTASLAPYLSTEILFRDGDDALDLGVRLAAYALPNREALAAFEPRVRYRHRWKGQRVLLTAERVSQTPLLGILLEGGGVRDFVPVSNQASVAYGRSFGGVSALLTGYFQYTDREFAAEQDGFLISANNFLEIDPYFAFTTSTSTRRYGVELEVSGGSRATGWYYRGSTSVYRAESEQTDGSWAKDRYSSDYAVKLTLGREWAGRDKRDRERTYGLNLAVITYGGERTGRIVDVPAALRPYFVPPDYSQGFINSNGAYFRPDLRLYRTKVRARTTRTLALDLQNVAGVSNTAATYYDSYLNRANEREALGLIPVLSYRILWR
ncbi:hypothetical protein [Lewinella sp. IMCC34183]|uniref:hypothetical protein n=1 Tax=Lewinella sp. IMCC34183 TaxID=2248762 RepID=UPI001300583B|nr:hypothetical protein [Lewinella sp. IMCC34183]